AVLFFSLQPEIVALDTAGVNRSRESQPGIRLPFLQAPEFPGLVKLDRVLLLVLNVRERLLATLRSLERGDSNPVRKRSVRINRMRDLGGIGRHHQIPAHERKRGDVAAIPVTHSASYTLFAGKKSSTQPLSVTARGAIRLVPAPVRRSSIRGIPRWSWSCPSCRSGIPSPRPR